MPEESNAAAQVLGVIPNAYFDLIARVIPGCFFLFAVTRITGGHGISAITDVFLPNDKLKESTPAWLLVVAASGYVLGHALSPIVRFLEEGPDCADSIQRKFKESPKKLYYLLPPFWHCCEASAAGRKELQTSYNKLRCQNPPLAALAIRIRAEYTMYGGFAVALAIALVFACIRVLQALNQGTLSAWLHRIALWDWVLLSLMILGVPIMLYRHLHTWNRFRSTVTQLLKACKPDPFE
jgi:hypothetical protein